MTKNQDMVLHIIFFLTLVNTIMIFVMPLIWFRGK